MSWTTETSSSLVESGADVRNEYKQTTINSTWPTTRAAIQQVVSTSLMEKNRNVSTTTSSQYYFRPDFLPDEDRLDNDDVVFYVDSMTSEEDNLTRRPDDDYYVDVDDDALKARDLERIVTESATTTSRNRTTPSTSHAALSARQSSSSIVGGRQPESISDHGTEPPPSVSSSVQSTTTSTNSTTADTDWFLGSMPTTITASYLNTIMATTAGTSTAAVANVSPFTTMRSTTPQQGRFSDVQLDTRPTTSHLLSTWIFTPERRTTYSYVQYGYIDLDDLNDREFDVVRQSGTDEGPEPGDSQVTTSTGIVLVVSIVVASLLLLAVIVLLVFYRYDRAFFAADSLDTFPAGCRRYLASCKLGPSTAVTHSATVTTSSPPNVPTSVDERQATCSSKSDRLSAETIVVRAAQMKHSRVPNSAGAIRANNHGVIEWYV